MNRNQRGHGRYRFLGGGLICCRRSVAITILVPILAVVCGLVCGPGLLVRARGVRSAAGRFGPVRERGFRSLCLQPGMGDRPGVYLDLQRAHGLPIGLLVRSGRDEPDRLLPLQSLLSIDFPGTNGYIARVLCREGRGRIDHDHGKVGSIPGVPQATQYFQ